jgi:hypothetical protein
MLTSQSLHNWMNSNAWFKCDKKMRMFEKKRHWVITANSIVYAWESIERKRNESELSVTIKRTRTIELINRFLFISRNKRDRESIRRRHFLLNNRKSFALCTFIWIVWMNRAIWKRKRANTWFISDEIRALFVVYFKALIFQY